MYSNLAVSNAISRFSSSYNSIGRKVTAVHRRDILKQIAQVSFPTPYESKEISFFASKSPKFSPIIRRYSTTAYYSKQNIEDRNYYNKRAVSHKIRKPIKVVFDLDCVLVSDICMVEDRYDPKIEKILGNIGEDSIVESCGYYFYLYNGWKELIKYVMELSDNNLIFFSSGARERNEDIIPKMLERVLGRDPMEYMRNNVKIFSRHHTIDTLRMPDEERKKYQPAGMWGNKKKDLRVAVSAEELKYTVLIDDDQTYILPGQEKNLLRIIDQSAVLYLHDCVKMSRDHKKIVFDGKYPVDSFLNMNKLFYAAGVLRDVCDTYSRVDRDLVDIMWDNHGFKVEQSSSGGFHATSESYKLLKRYKVYQSGLKLLKEINSDIDFLITPKK